MSRKRKVIGLLLGAIGSGCIGAVVTVASGVRVSIESTSSALPSPTTTIKATASYSSPSPQTSATTAPVQVNICLPNGSPTPVVSGGAVIVTPKAIPKTTQKEFIRVFPRRKP
jgi:hypothetical protein